MISIHAPIVGCDDMQYLKGTDTQEFQSTHPSWGATTANHWTLTSMHDFNPRTHRGVRLYSFFKKPLSIRFQSTHPSWGATTEAFKCCGYISISIHAPIVGCDMIYSVFQSQENNFNPRTHRGVRPCKYRIHRSDIPDFNPRTHRGVRRMDFLERFQKMSISIHAPIVGCDTTALDYLATDNISIHAPIVGCDLIVTTY